MADLPLRDRSEEFSHPGGAQRRAVVPPYPQKPAEIVQASNWDASWVSCSMHILLGRGLRVDARLSDEIMTLDWPGNVSVFPWINWIRWLGTRPRIGIKKMDGMVLHKSLCH